MVRSKGTELSVFKGREAKLNRAIFQALALKGPQTTYDIHKQARSQQGLKQTKYASVNKRVRSLEELGYVRKKGVRKTKAGFDAPVYEITVKSYVALFLASVNLEELLSRLDEFGGNEILAHLLHAFYAR